MTRWLFAIAVASVVASCKNRDIPYKPPKQDAAAVVADAGEVIDAAVATTKLGATKVAVGENFSCAVLTDKTLRCWGRNNEGQLGTGTMTDSPAPVAPKLVGVIDVVVGTAHACALLDDRSVTCWGRINYGHAENLLLPTGVAGVAKVKRLFAVRRASCATLDDGELVCWGDVDLQGHLRLPGSTIEHRVPTPVEGLSKVAMLTVNGALHEDGTVSFWGADGVPEKTALTGVSEIASSGEEVCGLREDGSVACVGPTTVCAANAPKPPVKKAPAKAPAKKAPAKKTATKTTKKTAKKPAPKKPEPKKPEPKPEPAPPKEQPIEVLALPPAKHLAFDVGLCVVTKTGALQCLAARDGCKQDSPWPGLANLDRVNGFCALARDGAVKCWDVDRKSRLVSAIAEATNVRDLVVSSTHACALRSDHEIVCWGSNKFGALGRVEIDEDPHREARPVVF
ncbi:MAG TPA: hypothetical protein VL326_26075 [Kofleriaceae bacterium]|nr:hypothetical protein [Kofleriaceae bacterium]